MSKWVGQASSTPRTLSRSMAPRPRAAGSSSPTGYNYVDTILTHITSRASTPAVTAVVVYIMLPDTPC